jgi:hypothetical protein
MLSKGELCRAPIKNPKRVLDLGTGTGIWALDFAELAMTQHLLRTVTNYEKLTSRVAGTWYTDPYSSQLGSVLNYIGIDLSPIQPSWYLSVPVGH